MEAKDAEVRRLLEEKHLDLEEMKKRLKEQERERQSELLKLQMEVRDKVRTFNVSRYFYDPVIKGNCAIGAAYSVISISYFTDY